MKYLHWFVYRDEEGAGNDEDVWGGKVKKIEQNIIGFRNEVNDFQEEIREQLQRKQNSQLEDIKSDLKELKSIIHKIVQKQEDMAEDIQFQAEAYKNQEDKKAKKGRQTWFGTKRSASKDRRRSSERQVRGRQLDRDDDRKSVKSSGTNMAQSESQTVQTISTIVADKKYK